MNAIYLDILKDKRERIKKSVNRLLKDPDRKSKKKLIKRMLKEASRIKKLVKVENSTKPRCPHCQQEL